MFEALGNIIFLDTKFLVSSAKQIELGLVGFIWTDLNRSITDFQ